MFYKIFRRILFLLPPETAHAVVICCLNFLRCMHLLPLCKKTIEKPVTVKDIQFSNPLGISAGFDKYAKTILGVKTLGAGYIELGTFTPKPQLGNSKPRLFRLKADNALINRMGLNNCGIDAAITRLQKVSRDKFPVGISITKNNDTAFEHAIADYEYCIEKAYPYCNYITANVSCPNVNKSREFWGGKDLEWLLKAIKNKQTDLTVRHEKYVPIFIKISPDLTDAEIQSFATLMNASGLDGVVATNTTVTRPDSLKDANRSEKGGLSGEPLFVLSLHCVKELKKHLDPELVLIGVGGIHSVETAQAMLDAGCQLLQLYTGLIYEGPGLIRRILKNF